VSAPDPNLVLWAFVIFCGVMLGAVTLRLVNDVLEDTMFDWREWRRKR